MVNLHKIFIISGEKSLYFYSNINLYCKKSEKGREEDHEEGN